MVVSTDEQIKREVVDRLYWDSRVDASDVSVEVSQGEVNLRGNVPTYIAKRAAEIDARLIPGVTGVHNRLDIEYPTTLRIPSDQEIATNIKNLLSWNASIDIKDISLAVVDGFVTLKGTVDSFWKKLRAEELVLDLQGVNGITNELAVVPSEDVLDKRIAEDIVASMKRGAAIDVDALDVTVDGGVVTLSGSVPSWMARTAAYDIAKHTVGVRNVINRLAVK